MKLRQILPHHKTRLLRDYNRWVKERLRSWNLLRSVEPRLITATVRACHPVGRSGLYLSFFVKHTWHFVIFTLQLFTTKRIQPYWVLAKVFWFRYPPSALSSPPLPRQLTEVFFLNIPRGWTSYSKAAMASSSAIAIWVQWVPPWQKTI
jgi:hypothetical protein